MFANIQKNIFHQPDMQIASMSANFSKRNLEFLNGIHIPSMKNKNTMSISEKTMLKTLMAI